MNERRAGLLLLALVLAASRLALLANGVWEQDEALFCAGALDFNLLERRPHPPGFPLWILVGKLGVWLLGDPLPAYQLVSALASIATALLLAELTRGLLGDRSSLAAAALYAFVPAVWLHAPRAFSTTPALALLLAGLLILARRGPRSPWSWLVFAAAALTRPPLLPLILLAAIGAWHLSRGRMLELFRGFVLMAGVGLLGTLPVLIDVGGLAAFLQAFAEHGGGHFGTLDQAAWSFAGLGLVRGLGGALPGLSIALLAGLGLAEVARREDKRCAIWLGLGLVLAIWWFVGFHNRTYTRYVLPAFALAIPLAVLGLEGLSSARWAQRLSLLGACAWALWTAPAMWLQATARFPPMAAIEASPVHREVVVDGGLSAFRDLAVLSGRGGHLHWRQLLDEDAEQLHDAPVALLWATPGRPHGIGAPGAVPRPFDLPAGLGAERYRALAQGRWLEASLLEEAVLSDAEVPSSGLSLDSSRRLSTPAQDGSLLGLVIEVEPPGWRGRLQAAERSFFVDDLPPGRHALYLPLAGPGQRPAEAIEIVGEQGRARLRRAWIESPARRPETLEIEAAELYPVGLDGKIDTTGLHGLETALGTPARQGRWSGSEATLWLPAAGRVVEIELCAPRPGPVTVHLTLRGHPLHELAFEDAGELEIGPLWETLEIELPPGSPRIELRLRVDSPLVPASLDGTSSDHRELGVVVGAIRMR